MPYIRTKPVREFLGFVAPGQEHLMAPQNAPLPTGVAAGDHVAFRTTRRRSEEMPWMVTQAFITEYCARGNSQDKVQLDERMATILNHIERRGGVSAELASADNGAVARQVGHWSELIVLCECGEVVEQECLCILLHLLGNMPLLANPLLIEGELKVLRQFVRWTRDLDPGQWKEELHPTTLDLRADILLGVCRRLFCHYLLGHLETNCYRQAAGLGRLFGKDDAAKQRWITETSPVRLRLALFNFDELLRICTKHASGDDPPTPIQPLLLHSLIAWHCGKASVAKPGALIEALEKTVEWTYSLCDGVSLRTPPPSWLQDDFSLELLGELARRSPHALNALQTIGSLPMPEFALHVLTDDADSLAAAAHACGAPTVCYWSWHHLATYVHCLQGICVNTSSPQLRTAAFNGPQYWPPPMASGSGSKDRGRGDSRASAHPLHVATDAEALSRNGQVSLTGLLSVKWWVGADSRTAVQPMLFEAFECVAMAAAVAAAAATGERNVSHAGGTMSSASALLEPCQHVLKKYWPENVRKKQLLSGKSVSVESASRLQLALCAMSSLNAMLADLLLKRLLPLSADVTPEESSRLSPTSWLSTPPPPQIQAMSQNGSTTTCNSDKRQRKAPVMSHPGPEMPQRPKVDFFAKVEQKNTRLKKSNSPALLHRQGLALNSIVDRQWQRDLPEFKHKVTLEQCSEDTVPDPPPSLADSDVSDGAAHGDIK